MWRHGRTAWNLGNRFQGQLDPPLDEVGVAQAAAAAQVLARLEPAVLVTSDLTRARSTAAALEALGGLTAVADPRLREIGLGTWEGLTHAEAAERFPEEYAAWRAGLDLPRGAGETYAQVGQRSADALTGALAGAGDGGVVVAVLHGGTARAAIGVLLELPAESWWRLAPLGNCRWSVLVEAERGWRLEEHNAGQLPEPERARGDDR